jgi:pilus assembly protein CpaB
MTGHGNRRFIILAVSLGLLGAILVYVASSGGSSTGGGSVTADTPVVVAKTDIPARTRITAAMVEVRLVGKNDAGDLAFTDPTQAVGQVTRFPIAANEQLLASKVVSLSPTTSAADRSLSFVIPSGMRAFSISTNPVQDAGGLLLPGDYVDIVVLYDIDFGLIPGGSADSRPNYLVQTLYQNVEVLAVAQTIVDVVANATPTADGQRVRNSEAKPEPGAGTVTLALTPEQAQRLYLAEANGTIRFALRPFGDADQKPIDYTTKIDLYPNNILDPASR